MTPLLVTVAVVVAVSATCSLFEAVLYAVPASHVETLARDGHPALSRLREHVDRPIAAILSLNTIANTAGAAVAGALAADALGAENVIWFSAVFTFAILLLSEIIPKTAGVVYARPLARIVARPMAALVWIFRPLVWVVGFLTRLVARGQSEEGVSPEEIISLARLGSARGSIDRDDAKVIQNVLSLEHIEVRDIMTPRTVVFSLPADTTIEQARSHQLVLTHSRVPVFQSGPEDIVGVVHRRDLLAADDETAADTPVVEVASSPEYIVQTASVDTAMELMLAKHRHLLIVLDEFGGMAGLVTLEDVMEEILGKEIIDEFDQVADMRELARQRKAEVLQRVDPG